MQSDTLRFYRTAQNLKQKTIAGILQMSQANYSNLENGKTKLTYETAKKLAAHYGVNRDIFLSEETGFTSDPAVINGPNISLMRAAEAGEGLLEPVLQRMDMLLNLLADEKEMLAQERKQLSDVFNKLAQNFGPRL